MAYAYSELVDRGERCTNRVCRATKSDIERTEPVGVSIFTCRLCGQSWFDHITQPVIDPWFLDAGRPQA